MSALLVGLSVAWLLLSLVQLCRRRSVPVIYVPVVIALPAPPPAEPAAEHEDWLRRQLEGLDPRGLKGK
jgi:hypothetical protein